MTVLDLNFVDVAFYPCSNKCTLKLYLYERFSPKILGNI